MDKIFCYQAIERERKEELEKFKILAAGRGLKLA